MTKEQFEYKFRDWDGVDITDNYTLWRKPLRISDIRSDVPSVRFKTIEEAFGFVLDDGRRVGDIIETWAALPEQPLDGDIIWHIKGKE